MKYPLLRDEPEYFSERASKRLLYVHCTKLSHAGNTDTAIFSDYESLSVSNCCANFLYGHFLGFNIETQGLPPTVYKQDTEMISHQRGNLKRHLTSNLAMCFRTTVCVGQLRLNLTIPTVLDIYLILSSPNSGDPENQII